MESNWITCQKPWRTYDDCTEFESDRLVPRYRRVYVNKAQ